MLVLFDQDVVDGLRSRLPGFRVVSFRHPGVPQHDVFVPSQLGWMYREASAPTEQFPDVWVVGVRTGSARRRAARFADQAASMSRRPVLRDSMKSSRGTLEFRRWLDHPGGTARRAEMRLGMAYAESVMARGIPQRTPISRPFTSSELWVDPDTLSYYVGRIADTSFYSIGGCDEVQNVFWNASEWLGHAGPGVVPVLVDRMADPDPFVRDRVQEALCSATQDERILARTSGTYLRFYDLPADSARGAVTAWWTRFGHFWAAADSVR